MTTNDDRYTDQDLGPGFRYAAPPEPPKKKRHVGRWIALGAVVLLFAGCAALAVGASDSINDSLPQPTDISTPAATGETKPPAQAEQGTVSQRNALKAAKNYLSISGFSRLGLIRQLSSSAGDGYSKTDATYAADHVGADWNEQAVRTAKSYLETTSFSRSGLIRQLSSSAGDQYTVAQATYAAEKVGL